MIWLTLSLVVVVYLAGLGVLFLVQRSLMYHPTQNLSSPALSGIPEASSVLLSSEDGITLQSWYSVPKKEARILVYFHGNAGNISDRAFKVRPYIDAGLGIMLVGYRGYGDNPGYPTEIGLFYDGSAALAYLEKLGFPPKTWLLYGESLGSAVAVEMAQRYATAATPVGALILEAPFTSMSDVAAKHYPYVPARALVKDRYDSQAKITTVNTRLLIFHGDRDRVVPISLGKQLFDKASEPKRFYQVKGAGHNDLYDFGSAKTVIDFLNL